MRLPVKPTTRAVGRFVDRLVAKFRGKDPVRILPPPGKLAAVRHAAKGTAPRYLRRHWRQAGLLMAGTRLAKGPMPTSRRGRKARARISRLLASQLAVSTRQTLPRLRVADRKKEAA